MKGLFSGIALLMVTGPGVWGQFGYTGCTVSSSDFQMEYLINQDNDPDIASPIKMDFDMDAQGNVDIYFVEKGGALKYYSGAAQSIAVLGQLNPETDSEDGLVGLVLDPNFKTNFRIFLYYSVSGGFRISRFELDPGTKALNLASEIALLTIPSGRGRWHTGGAMQFDEYGDLWVTVGDNESAQKGPANTNDLRGGMLRIHPEEDGTYTVPAGNLWEHGAAYFAGLGQDSIAADYQDPTKVKREIYAMGTRNAYTLSLDPVRRWAVFGDCGPDYMPNNSTNPAQWTEEQGLITAPAFLGWPYYSGNQHVEERFPADYDEPGEQVYWEEDSIAMMDPAAPINVHPEAGVHHLLPATPGTHVYAHSCAMSGPIVRYDGSINNPLQIPPHFNRKWLLIDFNDGWIKAATLTESGELQGTPVDVMTDANISLPLDMQMGPDGALYVLNLSCADWYQPQSCTGISKITYHGTCPQDPALLPEKSGCTNPGFAEYDASATYPNPAACLTPTGVIRLLSPDVLGVSLEGRRLTLAPARNYSLTIRDTRGNLHSQKKGSGSLSLDLPSLSGIFLIQIETEKGRAHLKYLGL